MENWRKFVNLTICGLNFDSNKQPCSIQMQAYHRLFVLQTCASSKASQECKIELTSPKRPVWHTRVLPRIAAQQ